MDEYNDYDDIYFAFYICMLCAMGYCFLVLCCYNFTRFERLSCADVELDDKED